MKTQKLASINDLTSPLFRIMTIHNANEPARRLYDNNVCAFHIGKGFILSVGHALRAELSVFRSMPEARFQTDIIPHLSANELQKINQWFLLDNTTKKRYLNITDETQFPLLFDILRRINYDTRILTLYERQICKPYLVIQQRAALFYNNAAAHGQFDPNFVFQDPISQRQTYLIETELVDTYSDDDVAIYRIINTHENILNLIPKFEIDAEIYDESNGDFYCLQIAPSDLTPGRMINEANIEGLIDQWTLQTDRIAGGYVLQGLRYLIKGYFRFGSSGAPYIKFDNTTNTFKVNAIQSEACPIQLTIKNDRVGNFQWINAIATPLANVIDQINVHMNA
jgi:hypothetical protein